MHVDATPDSAADELSESEIRRYARHIVLPEIGGRGQARLLHAAVLVVGAGGLGSPLLLYLAAAGIGRLGIVDDDVVDEGNLQRQVVHDSFRVGTPKAASARDRLAKLSPATQIDMYATRLMKHNADELVRGFDVVADGTDNHITRLALHAAAYRASVPLVSGSVQGMDGQLTTFKAYLGAPHPCLHCLYPEPPSDTVLPSCAQAGVLGPAAGVVGTLQAVEVIKELLGIGESLSGQLLLYDALAARFERIRLPRLPDCACCGRGSGEISTIRVV